MSEIEQHQEKELMLRTAADVALLQLQRGSFLSFAVTLGSRHNANTLFTEDLEPDASKAEIERYWAGEIRQAINPGDTRTACYCIRVRVPVEEGGSLLCILIHLEHVEGGAENYAFPIKKDQNSRFVLDRPMSLAGERVLFPE